MPQWLVLFSTVPLVTAAIGWLTNWAAVKMIFYPTTFFGLGRFGWQAILYKQGDKFAAGVADMVSNELLSSEELAARFQTKQLQSIISAYLQPEIPETCAEIVNDMKGAGTWENMPVHVRALIIEQVGKQSEVIVGDVLVQIQAQSNDILDIRTIVFEQLSGTNLDRLARLTKRIGKSEFKFIEYYGGIFGFVIGLVQVGAWQIMHTWWLMPIVGVIVGLVTNWLALQMIFRPQEPTTYFGLFTYQGLFAKRQKDIARDYGHTAENEILTPQILVDSLLRGEKSAELMATITTMVRARIKEQVAKFKGMIPGDVPDDMFDRAEGIVTRRLIEKAPDATPEVLNYLDDKMDVGNTVEFKLGNMPKDDFERVLRGVFEEDEITLILVGGALGGVVGFLQGYLVTVM